MRNFNAQNERLKRKYIDFIKETKGRDHKTLDKIMAALVKFEESTKYKQFKGFHIDQAGLFGPEDALFPKPERELVDGKFAFRKVSREPYANSAKINMIVKQSFANVQLSEYMSHSFRSTLSQLMSDFNLSVEEQKAWSQNLGHKHFATTVSHYMKVSEQRQVELIAGLKGG